ncbi:N-6 DNA methylase [Spirillospora sp. NPDC049652]
MAQDATVTAADIARLAGVGRAAVSNWRKRHDDFPQPVGGTATSPTFSLAEVQGWLRDQGKLTGSTDDEFLWQDLRRLADEADLADILGFPGAFLLFLHRTPDAWEQLSGLADERLAAELPKALGGDLPSNLAAEHLPIVRRLAALAADRGPRDAFEFLRERYLDLHKRRAYETPPAVAALAVRLADPPVKTVLDPACGSGGFLLAALDHTEPLHLLGQEIDADLARLTAIRLALRTDHADIRTGDSLRADAFPTAEADLVATAPPFNDRNWGHDELTTDLRWEYGLPPRTEPELAWVQHALAHTRPGGLAVILMPPAAAGRRAGRRIRQQFLRRGVVRAVIGLPPGAVPNMAVSLSLWVLRRPASAERPPSQVLMAETSDAFAEEALDVWRRFRADPESDLDEPGLAKAVRIIDLLDDEVDLTPSRHITPPAAAPAIDQVAERRARVLELLRTLPGLLPEVDAAGEPPNASLMPISELTRLAHLTVHQAGPAAYPNDGDLPPYVLTAKEVVQGRQPAATDTPAGPGDIVLHTGDVVVPAILRTPAALVIERPGAVLGRHLFLLRPDPDLLDPHYLAGVLRSSLNLRHYATTSTSYRVDVRRTEIPLLPIEEQRRHGEAFHRLHEFSTRLQRAADLGTDLAALLNEALVDAMLRPTAEHSPERGER